MLLSTFWLFGVFYNKKKRRKHDKLCIVTHACNFSILEPKLGRPEFEASLGCKANPYLKKNKQKNPVPSDFFPIIHLFSQSVSKHLSI